MLADSDTFAVFNPDMDAAVNVAVDEICPFAAIAIPEPADNADTTRAFVKYKLLADSTTFAETIPE